MGEKEKKRGEKCHPAGIHSSKRAIPAKTEKRCNGVKKRYENQR